MVIGYLRNSTHDQGKGLDAQRRAIESYAKNHRIDQLSFISDKDASKSKRIRKGLDRLRELLKES